MVSQLLSEFFNHINIIAVLVAGTAYWMLGALWYSALFGQMWVAELAKIGHVIQKPSSGDMITKSVITLLFNILIATGTALVVFVFGTSTWDSGIKLGLVLGVCFSFSTIAIAFNWESRSLKLLLIDAGYAVFGIVICAVILSVWH